MQLALEKPSGPFSGRIFSLAGSRRTLYTPLFIPSFSATVRSDWRRVMKATAAGVARDEMVLISAFDLADGGAKQVPRNFAALMLDSGGYEARRLRTSWSQAQYKKARSLIAADVVVAYDGDHATSDAWKTQLKNQLASLSGIKPGTLRTVLLHVASDENIPAIARALAKHGDDFDIVGLAEKELAFSIVDRIAAVRLFRTALDQEGVVRPIHLFGADHPLSLVAYSYAGADLFDGLGWATEYYSQQTLTAMDASHAPLSSEWRALAKRKDATDVGALYEWNLETLSALMAGIRKSILKDDVAAAAALLDRSALAEPLIKALNDGQ